MLLNVDEPDSNEGNTQHKQMLVYLLSMSSNGSAKLAEEVTADSKSQERQTRCAERLVEVASVKV